VSTGTTATTSELGSSAQRERRQRILDATIALASEGGFDAVQMRSVAESAEVALGTLYRYFPSKIHLLVSALAREFERAQEALGQRAIPGDTEADRVINVLRRITRGLQGDQHLTEALTRAFMFADSTVQDEIHHVGRILSEILTHAMRPDAGPDDVTDDDVAVARVIGDVWLSALVAWVSGRSTAPETAAHMERAVRLVLR
jgi:AcrR family transcriptional regulator